MGFEATSALGLAQAAEMAALTPYMAVLVDATNVGFEQAIRFCVRVKKERPHQKVVLLLASHHVLDENECPDLIVVREHPDQMFPKLAAALRGGVPVDDGLTEGAQ